MIELNALHALEDSILIIFVHFSQKTGFDIWF